MTVKVSSLEPPGDLEEFRLARLLLRDKKTGSRPPKGVAPPVLIAECFAGQRRMRRLPLTPSALGFFFYENQMEVPLPPPRGISASNGVGPCAYFLPR